MATIETLERVFILGATEMPDPDPAASPEAALALYEANYPALRYCTLAPPREEGGRLIYEVQRPAATTKGKSKSADADLEAEIRKWEKAQADKLAQKAPAATVNQVRSFLKGCLRAEHRSPEDVDPSAIPMC